MGEDGRGGRGGDKWVGEKIYSLSAWGWVGWGGAPRLFARACPRWLGAGHARRGGARARGRRTAVLCAAWRGDGGARSGRVRASRGEGGEARGRGGGSAWWLDTCFAPHLRTSPSRCARLRLLAPFFSSLQLYGLRF
jgi:hypothetical protein